MLPFVDCVKQLLIFAGVEFSRIGHKKTHQKVKYEHGAMISESRHDPTDTILQYPVSREEAFM